MNKEGTGKLIKDARGKKGLTQTELGELVGVSNKAVSRWETGESFPDVALLDDIANVLGLQIEELVRGEKKEEKEEKEEGNKDLWNEIVLELKLQQKSRRKQLLGMVLCWGMLLALTIFSLQMFRVSDARADIFLIAGMAAVMIFTIVMQRNVTARVQGKWVRAGKVLSVVSGCYAVLLAVLLPAVFRYRMSGVTLHYQLCAVWLIQMGWMTFCIWLFRKEEGQAAVWMLVAEAVILFVLLYDNLLHCLAGSMEEAVHLLAEKLLTAGVLLAVALFANDIVRKKHSVSGENPAA